VDEHEQPVIHGSELKPPDELSEEDRRRIRETAIFARITPEQKLNLIELMQNEGLTTAMTGDGVNDAPALKKADIGIAMGRRSTDAARQAADMVLRDDSFLSIVAAIRQGRIIFDNIRKSVMFMLCTNVAEVIAVAFAAVAGGYSTIPIPLLPLQILYLNVITDVFPALALGMSSGEADVMARPPRPRSESILTKGHWISIAGWATLMAACVLGCLAAAHYVLGFDRLRTVTVSFLTLAFGKLWFVFNLRNPGTRLFDNDVVKNPYVLGSMALCSVLLAAAVYLPGLSEVLHTRDPALNGWTLLLCMSLIPCVFGQILRFAQTKRQSI
jgi:Ca2+-transporting ATPase